MRSRKSQVVYIMKDPWIQNKIVSSNWSELLTQKTEKSWSFAVSGLVLFGILFSSEFYSYTAHVISLFLFFSTALVLICNDNTVFKKIQAVVVLTGFFGSIGLIVYENL